MNALGGNHLPSLPRQIGHALAAATRVTRAALARRPIRVPSDVLTMRESICATCEENLNGRCKKCGCGVRSQFIRKTHLATEQCPLEPPKWGMFTDQ